MNITLQPVLVELHEAGDGVLVFQDRWLVALLVRLSDGHGPRNGRWFLEAGYGVLAERAGVDFADLGEAEAWVRRELQHPPGPFGCRLSLAEESPLEES
jgi:hypothetical protein